MFYHEEQIHGNDVIKLLKINMV